MQHPMMVALDGGRSLSAEQVDAEVISGWRLMASACEQAVTEMHPLHPERQEWLEMLAEFRAAARLPVAPALSRVG